MNKTIAALGIYFIVIFLSGCATTSRFMDKTTGISENSSDAMYGVRLYQGKLPSSIVYRSLEQ